MRCRWPAPSPDLQGVTEVPLKCDLLEVTEVGVGVNDDHWVLVELPLRMWVATIGYLRRTLSVQPGSSLVMYTGFRLRWVGFFGRNQA